MDADTRTKDEIREITEEEHEYGTVTYVSPSEAAAVMGKSPSTVLKWLRSGELAGYRIRDRWFVPVVRFSEDPHAPTTALRILVR